MGDLTRGLKKYGCTSDLTSYQNRAAFVDSLGCECVCLEAVSLLDFQSSVIHTASAAFTIRSGSISLDEPQLPRAGANRH
jgi:hypothetical protein